MQLHKKQKTFAAIENFIPTGFKNQNKPSFPLWSKAQLQKFELKSHLLRT